MSSGGNMPVEVGRGPHPLELGKPALDFILWALGAWKDLFIQQIGFGNSLAVQWLGLCASTAGGLGSIPGGGTEILHAAQPKINK